MEPGSGVKLFEAVKAHMGWDDAKTKLWFDTVNPLAGGQSPREFWNRRKEKCERWIYALIEESTPLQENLNTQEPKDG